GAAVGWNRLQNVVRKAHQTKVDAPMRRGVRHSFVHHSFVDQFERGFGDGETERRSSSSICGSILPPLMMATFSSVWGNSSRWNRNPATATAPLGSAMVSGFADSNLIAWRISSS